MATKAHLNSYAANGRKAKSGKGKRKKKSIVLASTMVPTHQKMQKFEKNGCNNDD
jgi:hypothetical protein